jgi:hypothetical protein
MASASFSSRTSSSPSSSSYRDYIKSIDIHSSISSEFRIRTLSGALLSLFTLLLTLYFISTEYQYNISNVTLVNHVHVMNQSPIGLEVSFDITFPRIPCALLASDANDPTGQGQSFHIDANQHRVWKHRLDANGRTIGKRSKFELGGTLVGEDLVKKEKEERRRKRMMTMMDERGGEDEEEDESDDEQICGSCYGAASDENQCCNTCDDVKRAYRQKQWHIPDISKIDQCKHLVRAEQEENEGCNIHGNVALSTGGGNLHFAPDRQWEKEGDGSRNKNLPNGFLDLNAILEMFNDGKKKTALALFLFRWARMMELHAFSVFDGSLTLTNIPHTPLQRLSNSM